MSDAAWLAVAATLSLSGMAGLALAMDVHWAQVMQRSAEAALGVRRGLRGLGALALLLALVACLQADRPSMAVLVWVMLLSWAAWSVALGLTWSAARSGRGERA